jgi:phosphoribosylaminoimidazolecarboxamide formyltransferase/IMP cyclohydrolase
MAVNRVGTIDDWVPVRTALLSVSDKTGLDALVRGLLEASPGMRLLSTGGTHEEILRTLRPAARSCLQQVSEYTGQPEMQGGLVKTLDYRIYLGLLSETHNPDHARDLRRVGARPIDLVVVNLYPFETTVERPGTNLEDARANIDIGGPSLVRAAAKNFHRVAVLADPSDYVPFLQEIAAHQGSTSLATRYRLAQKAFQIIARYDAAIAGYLQSAPLDAHRGIYTVRNGA